MENNNNNNLGEADAVEALKYLILNKRTPSKSIDKKKLNEVVQIFTELAIQGLSSETIKKIYSEIIFEEHYDIPTRRKLLYACIPQSRNFPYEIIPMAVSTIALPDVSATWQASVLSWLSGLLQFHVVDDSNRLLHVCYTSLFNMLSNTRLCELACKILCQITRREDVVPVRVQILLKLQNKIGTCSCLLHLLRIFKMFRPDLVVYRVGHAKRFPAVPRALHNTLLAAKGRREHGDEEEIRTHDSHIWPDGDLNRNPNPFHEPTVVPQPEILVYAETLEEEKKKTISVLQFRRIKDMAKHLSLWAEWEWPNSASALLWKPALIALFKPHDVATKIAVTNWLELALRTEVIEQLGNPRLSRQENLLDACIDLVQQTETQVPVLYHFLMEFLLKWDRYSFMTRVLKLLSCVPFVSSTIFFEGILDGFCHLMSSGPLSLCCAILEAFGATCATWALQAHREEKSRVKGSDWPLFEPDVNPVEGIYFLTRRLERVLLTSLLRFGNHPLLLNATLNYYNKVNVCCEALSLPLLVCVPLEVVFIVMTTADVVATHRLALHLTRWEQRFQKLKEKKASGDAKTMRAVSLFQVHSINFSIVISLDTLLTSKSFCDQWMEKLSPFLGEEFQQELRTFPGINTYGSLSTALPYLPLTLKYLRDEDRSSKGEEKREVMRRELLTSLAQMNLEGIERCARTYMQMDWEE